MALHFPAQAGILRHCHQLDYATSGVMCYARSKPAAGCAGWLFAERKTTKIYLALVRGHVQFDKQECSLPIAEDPSHPFKMMLGTPCLDASPPCCRHRRLPVPPCSLGWPTYTCYADREGARDGTELGAAA